MFIIAQHSSSTSLSASSQQSGPPSQKTPTPTPTPPPAPTPTPPLNTIRRPSTTSEAVTVQSQNPLQQNANQMAFLTSKYFLVHIHPYCNQQQQQDKL